MSRLSIQIHSARTQLHPHLHHATAVLLHLHLLKFSLRCRACTALTEICKDMLIIRVEKVGLCKSFLLSALDWNTILHSCNRSNTTFFCMEFTFKCKNTNILTLHSFRCACFHYYYFFKLQPCLTDHMNLSKETRPCQPLLVSLVRYY